MRGVDVLILVNTGTDVSPTWTAVGGQRGAKLSEKLDTVDVTSKDNGGAKAYEPGLYDWTISCDGIYVEDEAAYQALVNALRQRQKVKVRWSEGGTAVYEGTAIVTSRDLDAPYDGETTYSIELQGTGTPVLNPAP